MERFEVNIDLKKLKSDKERNFKERLAFVKYWANYIKTHSGENWSKQQKMLIDSQMPSKRFKFKKD